MERQKKPGFLPQKMPFHKIPVKKIKSRLPLAPKQAQKSPNKTKKHYTKYPPACPPPPRGQQPKTPWHLKSPALPKTVSQSPEKKCRFQRRKPANYPRILLCRILELCAFAKKNAVSLANQGCKGGKSRLPHRADEAEAVAEVPVVGAVIAPVRDGPA